MAHRFQSPIDYNPTNPACNASIIVLKYNATAPPWKPGPQATMSAVTAVLALLVSFTSLAAFVVFKPRYQRTRVRPLVVPQLALIGVVTYILGANVPSIWGFQDLPCWFPALVSLAVPAAFGLSLLMRAMYFLLMTRFAITLSVFGGRIVDASGTSDSNVGDGDAVALAPNQLLLTTFQALVFAASTVVHRLPTRDEMLRMQEDTARADQAKTLATLKLVTSTKGQLLFEWFVSMPFVVLNVVISVAGDPAYWNNCAGCFSTAPIVILIVLAEGLLIVGMGMFLAYRMRGLKDPFGVFLEGRLCLATAFAAVAVFVINLGVWRELTAFDPMSLSLMFLVMMVVYSTAFPLWLGYRDEVRSVTAHAKLQRQRQRVAGGRSPAGPRRFKKKSAGDSDPEAGSAQQWGGGGSSTTLGGLGEGVVVRDMAWVMGDARVKAAFTAYVETEFCIELVVFLNVTTEWKAAFHDVAATARVARAKRIAQSFIGAGAVQEVNVSERVTKNIRAALAAAALDPTKLSDEVFDEARKDVTVMLEHGPLTRFLETEEAAELVALAPGASGVEASGGKAKAKSVRGGGLVGASVRSSANGSGGDALSVSPHVSSVKMVHQSAGHDAVADSHGEATHAWNVLGSSLRGMGGTMSRSGAAAAHASPVASSMVSMASTATAVGEAFPELSPLDVGLVVDAESDDHHHHAGFASHAGAGDASARSGGDAGPGEAREV